MKSRWKALPLALVAVLAFGVVVASAAQAHEPRWKVKGSYLGSGVAKPFTGTSGASKLKVPGLGLTINCKKDKTSGSIVGSAEGSPGTNKEATVTYEECSIEGAEAVCTVSSGGTAGTIVTNKLKSRLVWLTQEGANAGDLLEPEAGSTAAFVHIVIAGAECGLAQEANITGSVIGEAKPVGKEVVTGELVFPTTAITTYWTGDKPSRTEHKGAAGLKFGGSAATYSSTELITLTGKEEVYGAFE